MLLPGNTPSNDKDEELGPPSSSEEDEEESDDDTSSTSSSSSLSAVQAKPRPTKPSMAASLQQKQLAVQKMKEDIKKKVREELTKDSSRFWRLRALMIQKLSMGEHLNSLTAEDVGRILDEV